MNNGSDFNFAHLRKPVVAVFVALPMDYDVSGFFRLIVGAALSELRHGKSGVPVLTLSDEGQKVRRTGKRYGQRKQG